MKVNIDGTIYQREGKGGISRIFNEMLPRISDIDQDISINIVTQGKLKQSLPTHLKIKRSNIPPIERRFGNMTLIKPIVKGIQSIFLGSGENVIWHTTYYSFPYRWKGPKIVTVFDMIHERFENLFTANNNDLFRQKKRQCVEQADAVICISETTRKDVVDLYRIDEEKTHVIHLAHNNSFRYFEGSLGSERLKTQKPFILYVGIRETAYKNFDYLIKAYSKWSKKREVDLVLVGRPWQNGQKERINELGIEKSVQLLTHVSDEELCVLYNQAFALVYPSLYEGFGIPVLEAMACGCPVIASKIPSTEEIAGDCPIYCDPYDEDSLMESLDRVIQEGRKSMRVENGIKIVSSYSWDKTAQETLSVYKRLM